MNLDEVFKKIEELKKEYTEDSSKDLLDRWEKDLKEAGVKISTVQLETVKEGILNWGEKINKNKKTLANDEKLSQDDRIKLFAENKVYKEVIDYFINPAEYIKYIINEIKNL